MLIRKLLHCIFSLPDTMTIVPILKKGQAATCNRNTAVACNVRKWQAGFLAIPRTWLSRSVISQGVKLFKQSKIFNFWQLLDVLHYYMQAGLLSFLQFLGMFMGCRFQHDDQCTMSVYDVYSVYRVAARWTCPRLIQINFFTAFPTFVKWEHSRGRILQKAVLIERLVKQITKHVVF